METLEKRHIEFNRDGFDDDELLLIYKKLLFSCVKEKSPSGFQVGDKKEFQ